eukprot:m.71744 g.71744  ORF g.71744 m.71744 type:complete len:102 (-) comp12271_c0_seq2:138-443(-)
MRWVVREWQDYRMENKERCPNILGARLALFALKKHQWSLVGYPCVQAVKGKGLGQQLLLQNAFCILKEQSNSLAESAGLVLVLPIWECPACLSSVQCKCEK